MPYPVRYSTRAYMEYEKILEYISENFGYNKAIEVDKYFNEIIDLIATNPFLYPCSNKRNQIRRCVISPQTTLYYRFAGSNIEIISFRDNKMDPKSLDL
jgi:plasmid stabilization system protein ParE